MTGSQIIAAGDITFVVNTDGLEGISIVSGGSITRYTGIATTVCAGQGMEDNLEADYFRLAH